MSRTSTARIGLGVAAMALAVAGTVVTSSVGVGSQAGHRLPEGGARHPS